MVLQPPPGAQRLCLVVTLFLLAVFFVFLDADFVAALQVIVYAGAIMVLFLFVIMLLNLQDDEPQRRRSGWQIADRAVGASLFALGLLYCCARRGALLPGPGMAAPAAGRLRRRSSRSACSLFTALPAAVRDHRSAHAGRRDRRRRAGASEDRLTDACVPTSYYIALSAVLFSIGVVGVLVRRNAIVIFMCDRADAERRQPGLRRLRAPAVGRSTAR